MAKPMVIVDDLHVVYRVYGAGGDKGTAATALMRIMRKQQRPSIREVHAIRGMSFVAYRGDVVGVIGRNGSGKSTLLRAVAGLLPAERGAVYSDGHAALLGVNAALLDDLTGERNVILGCLAMGMPPGVQCSLGIPDNSSYTVVRPPATVWNSYAPVDRAPFDRRNPWSRPPDEDRQCRCPPPSMLRRSICRPVAAPTCISGCG